MRPIDFPASYPRPGLVREQWTSLNGTWEFAFDDNDQGRDDHWERGNLPLTINVPFCYQSKLSGIGDSGVHPVVWYKRSIQHEEKWAGQRVLIHFEGVDQTFDFWVNSHYVGNHNGGFTACSFDITKYLNEGTNDICLRVTDGLDWSIPRGKQAPAEKIDRCWYVQTTGIWKPVWLEAVPQSYISKVRITPDINSYTASFDFEFEGRVSNLILALKVEYEGNVVCDIQTKVMGKETRIAVPIESPDYVDELHYWSPEAPHLYDVFAELSSGDGNSDFVQSYFGMRKIEAKNGRIYLNNRPYYLRMVLDQGYWRDGLMTPPSDDCFQHDIQFAKECGFNGARKHQKIEDGRFYYWADRLGLLVWAEMPSAYCFCGEEVQSFTHEWMKIVSDLYNHPSIIAWVPFNESWGVRNILHDRKQQNFAVSIYHLTKALDNTRLVSTNDGWEQVTSDICAIHDYYKDGQAFETKYENMDLLLSRDAQGRDLYAEGYSYSSQPIIITEYGGIAMSKVETDFWGYNKNADDVQELLDRIEAVTTPILENKRIVGFCYTQLTDVMQEANGLADSDHVPKAPSEQFRELFGERI